MTLSADDTSEIVSRYASEATRARVRKLLDRSPEKQERTLRDHTKEGIHDRAEILDRDAVDDILDLASALEVIAIGVGEAPRLPDPIAEDLTAALENGAVRTYYETYYPLALPALFRRRLGSGGERPTAALSERAHAAGDESPVALLMTFLELDARRARDIRLSFFLDLLDGYAFGPVDLDRILDFVESPEEFETRGLDEDSEGQTSGGQLQQTVRDYERRGVEGLEEFLGFSSDLHKLLRRAEGRPLLRAAMWLHYCYWFGNGSEGVRHAADELRKRLRNWAVEDDSEVSAFIRREADEVTAKLFDLTDWEKYADPLITASAPSLDVWANKQIARSRA